MSERREYLKIKIKNSENRSVRGLLRAVEFEDHGHYVIFMPSVNISAYGADRKEALEMLKVALDDFSETLTELPANQITEELKKFGFIRNKVLQKQYENGNVYIDREGILKNFNLPEDTKIKEELLVV